MASLIRILLKTLQLLALLGLFFLSLFSLSTPILPLPTQNLSPPLPSAPPSHSSHLPTKTLSVTSPVSLTSTPSPHACACAKKPKSRRRGKRGAWSLPLLDHRGLPRTLQVPRSAKVLLRTIIHTADNVTTSKPLFTGQPGTTGAQVSKWKASSGEGYTGLHGAKVNVETQRENGTVLSRRMAMETSPTTTGARLTARCPCHVAATQAPAPVLPTGNPKPSRLSRDDQLLLQRAAATPSTVTGGTPKVAFLFLTRGPLPLAPLWARFLEGYEDEYSVYVHTREGYEYPDGDLPGCFYRRDIPGKNTTWGTLSIVDAERRLIAHALLDTQNKWFILLSESCIPLYPFPFIRSYLLNSSLVYVRVLSQYPNWLLHRYANLSHELINPEDWRKGSQFFALPRDVARMVVADSTYLDAMSTLERPEGMYWDEHYLPTMLSKLVPERMSNRTLTWTKFKWRSPHPFEFGARDSKKKVREMKRRNMCEDERNSSAPCFLFARKFPETSLDTLLRMGKVLGY